MNPATQDLFSRYMAGMFDLKNVISVSTGFLAFFGNPANGSETIFSPDRNAVDIDIIKGNERIAALIPRGTISRLLGPTQKNLRSEQMVSFSRKYPLSEEEGDISGDMLLNRVAGESPYVTAIRMDRLRYHAAKIHHENIRRHVRLFEVLAAQSIQTGKQDAILGTSNADLQYDFQRTSTHIDTTSHSWSGSSATILEDIEACCAKGRTNGKVNLDMMICGSTAMNSFVKDATVKALADNRRFYFMQIGSAGAPPCPPKFQRFIDGGMIYQGLLKTPSGYELYVFTYLEEYTGSDGNPVKYLPVDKVVFAYSGARCDRYFGPPENLPMVPSKAMLYRDYFGFDPMAAPIPVNIKSAGGIIDPAMFYCDGYVSPDQKKITIRTQTAPIFATTQTDAFVTLDTEP